MYCKGSAFFIITSKYKVESIVLSKSVDISYNYYPLQNTIAELSYCFYIVWNLTIYLFETFILGVIKGVNHITRWFTPLLAEREVCEPNSRISLYINFLYVLTNHQCSIFVAVFWPLNDYHSDYLLKAQPLSFLGYKDI